MRKVRESYREATGKQESNLEKIATSGKLREKCRYLREICRIHRDFIVQGN